ncbi:MAG: SDR family NAD(P)-dependent oxidoreductase [Microbacteriaceae bacterium]
MTDRTIVVTGASDGIGAAAARAFADQGDRVVVIGRDPGKVEAVSSELGADSHVADFAELDQVRALADALLATCPRIDVLANNAGGIFSSSRTTTVDGHETTFQVNYLAPFLLTALLTERLVEHRGIVVNTSSVGNRLFGKLDLDDLENARGYKANKAYGDAKLAQILHARELQRRYGDRGLAAASFHPGNISTNFAHGAGVPAMFRLAYCTPLRHVLRSPAHGADTLVWLASSTPGVDWEPGEYYIDRKPGRANEQAHDPVLAAALWERSAAMVGVN